jgi:hypothetical protein
VAQPARLRRRPRCSTPGGNSTVDRRRLRRAWWGSGVLTGDGWRRSRAAAELQWPGRASTSPVAGGEDGGGEALSKGGRRRGRGRAH